MPMVYGPDTGRTTRAGWASIQGPPGMTSDARNDVAVVHRTRTVSYCTPSRQPSQQKSAYPSLRS